MDVDTLKVLKSLIEKKRQLQAELKEVQKEIDRVQPAALQILADEGIQNLRLDGTLLYIARDVRPKIKEGWARNEVVDALKEAGMDDFVKEDFNLRTLGAYFKEATATDDDFVFPDGLEMTEHFEIRLRR